MAHFTGRQIEGGTIQRYKNLGGFNDDGRLTHAIVSDAGIQVSHGRVTDEFQRRYRGDNWDGFISEEVSLVQLRTLEALQKPDRIMGIVTGRPEAEAQWTIERFGWKRYFPLVISREKQEGRGKPDPYPLLHALALLDAAGRHVAPEESVYVGDTVDDIEAARRAGMWSIGLVPPYLDQAEHTRLLRDKGAHLIVHSADVLPSIIDSFAERLAEQGTPEEDADAA